MGLKRTEQMRKKERKREKKREIIREEREISRLKKEEKVLKNYYFLSHSATVPSYI